MAERRRKDGTGNPKQGDGKHSTTSSHKHVQQSAHSRDAEKAVGLVKRIAKIVEARNARARKNQGS